VLEMTQMGEHPLLGVIAHRAGIYQDDVSFFNAVSKTESGLFERRSYKGRIQLVHLAPVGLEVHFHHAPLNLYTGAPAFSFAEAKLRGHPKLFICTLGRLMRKNVSIHPCSNY